MNPFGTAQGEKQQKMKKVFFISGILLLMSISTMAQRYAKQILVPKQRFSVHSMTHSFWSGEDDYRASVRINLPYNTEYWYYTVSVRKIDNSYKEAECNIYLLDSDEHHLFINYGNFRYYREGTRKYISEGTVTIESFSSGHWYLGLANPSLQDGIKVELEVIAIVRE